MSTISHAILVVYSKYFQNYRLPWNTTLKKVPIYGQIGLWFPLFKFTNFWRFTLEPPSLKIVSYEKKVWQRKLSINSYRFHVTGYYIMEFASVSFQWYFRFPNATESPSISTSQCISTQTSCTFSKCDSITQNLKHLTLAPHHLLQTVVYCEPRMWLAGDIKMNKVPIFEWGMLSPDTDNRIAV